MTRVNIRDWVGEATDSVGLYLSIGDGVPTVLPVVSTTRCVLPPRETLKILRLST